MKLLALTGLCGLLFLASAPATEPPSVLAHIAFPAFQQTWSGTLHDAACKMADDTDKCKVKDSTKTFSFHSSDGKEYTLDDPSNTIVLAALQTASVKTGVLKANISGAVQGTTLKVDTIQIH